MTLRMAERVATDELKEIAAGNRPNRLQIHLKNGYSLSSARSSKAVGTQGYQKIMEPVLKGMEKARKKSINAIIKKDFDRIEFSKLVNALDVFTKNINLLSGEPTERVAINESINKINALIINIGQDVDTETEDTLSRVIKPF